MGTIDLAALEIFRAVVQEGGITKAAAKLHRVQSNVTTRVKQLEARLGTALFLRHRRKLVLSPEGQLLLAYTDRLLGLASEAEAALRNGLPSGVFRLGTLESTAATRLPPVLARYHKSYPDVRIDLVTGTTGTLIAKVVNHEIEAAFVAEPFTGDDLDVQPIFREELVLIAPKSFPKVKGAKDVGRATVIAFATGCSYRRRLEAWLDHAGVVPERVMEFGSYHAIVACVAAGAGVAIVPRSVIRAVFAEAAVAVYPLPPAVADARTCLVRCRGPQSSALRALMGQLARVRRQ